MENIENKLEDNQMEFRPNISTIDNILIVRLTFEKSHEHNIDLYRETQKKGTFEKPNKN